MRKRKPSVFNNGGGWVSTKGPRTGPVAPSASAGGPHEAIDDMRWLRRANTLFIVLASVALVLSIVLGRALAPEEHAGGPPSAGDASLALSGPRVIVEFALAHARVAEAAESLKEHRTEARALALLHEVAGAKAKLHKVPLAVVEDGKCRQRLAESRLELLKAYYAMQEAAGPEAADDRIGAERIDALVAESRRCVKTCVDEMARAAKRLAIHPRDVRGATGKEEAGAIEALLRHKLLGEGE
jgi:hypothetical protein